MCDQEERPRSAGKIAKGKASVPVPYVDDGFVHCVWGLFVLFLIGSAPRHLFLYDASGSLSELWQGLALLTRGSASSDSA